MFLCRANNLTKARNPGTLLKMNPSQVKACNFTKTKVKVCNFIRNDLLLRYNSTTLLEVNVYNSTKIEIFRK